MKGLILLFVLISITVPAQTGQYRWDVKIGVDTAGQRIYKPKYKPEKETVQNLSSKTENPKPSEEERENGLRADAEKRKQIHFTSLITDKTVKCHYSIVGGLTAF